MSSWHCNFEAMPRFSALAPNVCRCVLADITDFFFNAFNECECGGYCVCLTMISSHLMRHQCGHDRNEEIVVKVNV